MSCHATKYFRSLVFRIVSRIGLATIVALTTTGAFGQANAETQRPRKDDYRPVPAKPINKGRLDKGATALGDLLRSIALGIQATGNYWLNVSQAEILRQHARSAALDNDNRRFEFFAGIESRRQVRVAEKRRENDQKRPLVYRSAYELPSDELNRHTGEIVWPQALLADEYADPRTRLEELFRNRRSYDSALADRSADIQWHIESLIARLQRHRSEAVSNGEARNDYLAAQKFLRGLQYESSFRQ